MYTSGHGEHRLQVLHLGEVGAGDVRGAGGKKLKIIDDS